MWTKKILAHYLSGKSLKIVIEHSHYVAELALEISANLCMTQSEKQFIEEAAMLHDIGVCGVYAPNLGLNGVNPYIMHGVLGRKILEDEGYPIHALVCERHTGVGLTCDDIIKQNLPLPIRDMTPQNLSEQIICFADLFYSKNPSKLNERKSVDKIRKKLMVFGKEKVDVFDGWLIKFNFK